MVKSDKRGPLRGLPHDLRLLLSEIEKEPVPERLLELARELQKALAQNRQKEPDRS